MKSVRVGVGETGDRRGREGAPHPPAGGADLHGAYPVAHRGDENTLSLETPPSQAWSQKYCADGLNARAPPVMSPSLPGGSRSLQGNDLVGSLEDATGGDKPVGRVQLG